MHVLSHRLLVVTGFGLLGITESSKIRREYEMCLRQLLDQFDGNVEKALAAYNAGQGTVDKLLARQKTRTYDAIATHLPAETQMYVPRVEATLLRREGIKLEQL